MNVISLTVSMLLLVQLVSAQTRQPSAPVKAVLDSAKVHQSDAKYADYLLIAVSVAKDNSDDYGKAVAYQRLGNYYYTRVPAKSLEYQYLAYDGFMSANDTARAAICLHSLAFVYDEQLNNIPKAIFFIEQSIELHHRIKDTMELGNMYKYIGVLKARAEEYDAAKRYVKKGIRYFKYKSYEPGIAVSYFDMATIYASQGLADSAIYYGEKSRKYWLNSKGVSRVVNVNNELIKWYFLIANDNEAHNLLLENEQWIDDKTVYWKDKLNHYMNAHKYYYAAKRYTTAQECLDKYNALRNGLKAKGIKTE